MEQKHTRQGVKVNTVNEEHLCDSRGGDFAFFCIMLPLMILMNFPANGKQASPGILLIDCSFVAYMLKLFLWGLHNYRFVTRNGLYLVRHGWAVHIPWRKIKNVEIIRYLQGKGSGTILFIHYMTDLTDEVTGTPIKLHKKRDYSFPNTNRSRKAFCRYSKLI